MAYKTDEEWQETLSPKQYQVLRRHGTEMRGSSQLNQEKRTGTFCLRRLRTAALRVRHEIRKRHRLAELLRADAATRSARPTTAAT